MTVNLDAAVATPALTGWPNFHNGVRRSSVLGSTTGEMHEMWRGTAHCTPVINPPFTPPRSRAPFPPTHPHPVPAHRSRARTPTPFPHPVPAHPNPNRTSNAMSRTLAGCDGAAAEAAKRWPGPRRRVAPLPDAAGGPVRWMGRVHARARAGGPPGQAAPHAALQAADRGPRHAHRRHPARCVRLSRTVAGVRCAHATCDSRLR